MILDGALATEIERRGFSVDSDLWSAAALAERPDLIKAVHADYLAAGADIITGASYQATVAGFLRHGFSREKSVALLKLSVRLAKDARDEFWAKHAASSRPRPLVAASVGPYGAFLADGSEYRGDYDKTEDELTKFHLERLEILAAEKPDVFACETIPSLTEAKAIVRALAAQPKIPAWISFSCRDESHTANGETIEACAKFLDGEAQIIAVGVNCIAPKFVTPLIKNIRRATEKTVVVYPNSGETYDTAAKIWRGKRIDFGEYAREWQAAGAEIIGGCCRTTPADTKRIHDTVTR